MDSIPKLQSIVESAHEHAHIQWDVSGMELLLQSENNRWLLLGQGVRCESYFLPWISLSKKQCVVYAASLSVDLGHGMASWAELAPLAGEQSLRLYELVLGLHFQQYQQSIQDAQQDTRLCIDLEVYGLQSEQALGPIEKLLRHSELAPNELILNLPSQFASPHCEYIQRLKYLGVQFCLSDIGGESDNIAAIWNWQPEWVCLSAELIQKAQKDDRIGSMLPVLVDMLHRSNAHIVASGIDQVESAIYACEVGIDLMRGKLAGEALQQRPNAEQLRVQLNNVLTLYQRQWQRDRARRCRVIDQLEHHVKQVCRQLGQNAQLTQACRSLLKLHHVQRCYVLNGDGIEQACVTSESLRVGGATQIQLKTGHHFAGRSFYRDAMEQPNQMQVSPRYLSLFDGKSVKTLSMQFRTRLGCSVFCCDIDPEA